MQPGGWTGASKVGAAALALFVAAQALGLAGSLPKVDSQCARPLRVFAVLLLTAVGLILVQLLFESCRAVYVGTTLLPGLAWAVLVSVRRLPEGAPAALLATLALSSMAPLSYFAAGGTFVATAALLWTVLTVHPLMDLASSLPNGGGRRALLQGTALLPSAFLLGDLAPGSGLLIGAVLLLQALRTCTREALDRDAPALAGASSFVMAVAVKGLS